jgi:hypothetical protein
LYRRFQGPGCKILGPISPPGGLADGKGMDWPFVIAAVVAGWAVLSVVGNERQRRTDQTVAAEAAAHAAEQAALAAAAAPPAAASPAH